MGAYLDAPITEKNPQNGSGHFCKWGACGMQGWRCSMEDALYSEYMAPLHQGRALPEQEDKFSFGFEKASTTQAELRDLIWREMQHFHPEVDGKAQ